MHILYVTEGVPDRSPEFGDGSLMIPFEVIRNLPEDVSVDLLTFDAGRPVPAAIRERCRRVSLLPPRGPRSTKIGSILTPLDRGTAERTTYRAIAAVRGHQHDVALMHGPHALPLAIASAGPVVMQVVDPWSRRLQMEAARLSGKRRQWALHKARQFHRVERLLPRSIPRATVGREDAEGLGRALRRPVVAVPNGVSVVALTVRQPPAGLTICFVGSLEYGPNIESATVLAREIAPVLWEQRPDARVVIAGRRPGAEVKALASERIEVRGDVPSIADLYAESNVAVFPDRRGLGVRNSVTEAIASGIPVVATQVAAREQPASELLRVEDGTDAMVAAILNIAAAPPSSAAPNTRTWSDATDDYLELCRRAIQARS